MTDTVPGRGQYTEAARLRRVAWLRERTGTALASAAGTGFDPQALTGNVENFVGSVEVPVGLAGPLLFSGGAVRDSVVAPLATTEGALIASASRGARAITASGGVNTRVLSQRMSRAPVFEFADLSAAVAFTDWLRSVRPRLDGQIRLISRHARLVDIEPYQIGRYLHVRFVFETADAAGQNMTTAATWQICRWIEEELKDDAARRPVRTVLDGNLSSDKKVSAVSMLAGRGSRVTAECRVRADVVASVLKSTTADMVKGHTAAILGAQQAGMTGYGINAANIVAALFVATGQDIASVHESGVSIVSIEPDGDDLIAAILLPNLVVGTVGGGTALPHQHEWLAVLGCAGEGGAHRFAEIVAGFALALDLSTLAAMVSGQFASAHRRLGRARPVEWLLAADLDAAYLRAPMAERLADPGLHVDAVTFEPALHGDGISSELGALGERRKFVGLLPMAVRWTAGDGTTTTADLVAKVKARGEDVVAGIARVASLCGREVAQAWERWGADSDFAAGHRRELGVYRRTESVLTALLPRCYGTVEDDGREAYLILMERLTSTATTWDRGRIDDALRAIAAVHGHWLGRDQQLLSDGWLHRPLGDTHLAKARELWESLARYNAAEHPELVSARRLDTLLNAAANLGFWSQELAEMPRTLVHNDFNPRNVVALEERIVAYDWELATVDVPQRDVAEFLAFTLGPDASAAEVEHHVGVHRDAVAATSPRAAALVAGCDWRRGYRLALLSFLLSRVQLYGAAHAHREFAFLPSLMETAFRLWDVETARDGG